MASILWRSVGRSAFEKSFTKSIDRPVTRTLLSTPSRSFSHSIPRRTAAETTVVPPVKQSLTRRFFTAVAIGIVFTTTGFAMAAIPAYNTVDAFINPPTDAETLKMFKPSTDLEQEVEDFINTHPLALELRQKAEFSESRPHLKVPEKMRGHNLTAGTLLGPNRVVVPPFVWSERGGKSIVSISYIGGDLCGHPGIVHGGFLATILDEGLARCCFAALPNKIGMTANLNINYRSPAPADTFYVLKATTTKVEGRKAWVEGRIETLVGEGETPRVIAEASALFIEPRTAATMARVYPTDESA